MITQGGFAVNKEKIANPASVLDSSFLLSGKYILLQKGKKGYFIVKAD
jgi:hypothetical protein